MPSVTGMWLGLAIACGGTLLGVAWIRWRQWRARQEP